MRTIIKGFMFSVAAAAMLAAVDGHAQTSSSNSNSTSSAGAASQSSSGAAAISGGGNQTLGVTTNTGVGVGIDQRSYGSPVPNQYYQNQHSTGDVTVRTTPMVYAPPVSGGNPCTLAVSGGVSVIGWGASAGGTFVDEDCANRQKIAMIHNAGYKGAARELMCNDRAAYMAFKTAGEPCAWRAQFEPQGAAPAPMPAAPVRVSAPVPAPMAAPKVYPKCNPRAGIVDNCAG